MCISDQHTKITRNADLVATDMDGELVMMNLARGEYFGLNAVGSRIWEMLASPCSIAELCYRLEKEFAVDREQCLQEVSLFINELLSQGLAQRV